MVLEGAPGAAEELLRGWFGAFDAPAGEKFLLVLQKEILVQQHGKKEYFKLEAVLNQEIFLC